MSFIGATGDLLQTTVCAADEVVAVPPVSDVTQTINQHVDTGWKTAEVTPAPDCSDRVFVRRVYLDLAGRIPTVQELRTFLEDQRPDNRTQLVDLLLASEDYVQHFADTFDTLLMGRSSSRRYEERRRHEWHAYLERVFRDNRPWNDVAAEILLARPKDQADRGAVWFLYERKDDHQKIAEAVAPAVFGIHIECAQCHDHMIATEIEQKHYWGLVAFFNRSKNTDTPNGPRVSESAIGGFSDFANLEGSSSPNVLTFFDAAQVEEARPAADAKQEDADELYEPAVLDGDPRVPRFSRREQFVDQILKDHPLVARAFVNRVWAMLLGRGIVHPFDKLDSAHPPSHPELLDFLADDFRTSGYDIRRLIRAIVLSRPYQLSAQQPEGAEDPALFAWGLQKPLTAEQESRSIQLAVRGAFQNDSPLNQQLRENIPDVMPEESVTTIGTALFLTNNNALNQFIADSHAPNHLIPSVLSLESPAAQVSLLFETVFGRTADEEELQVLTAMLSSATGNHERTLQLADNVVWAMLTSAEFRFNH
ncbi:MAG: DUF1549 domain-containing protein [Planctomycetaceae bacterium]|nr:DUF1549 domain-containing protein [Planctomycetaceae bacterium]